MALVNLTEACYHCFEHLPTVEQYLHQVNIMLPELGLRMMLYFFQKIICSEEWHYNSWECQKKMFELLFVPFTKLMHFPHIVRLCDFFTDYVIGCGKRSIVPNHTSTQYQKPCF